MISQDLNNKLSQYKRAEEQLRLQLQQKDGQLENQA